MVATDSYRLSVKETPVESSVAEHAAGHRPGADAPRAVAHRRGVADDTITILPTENQMLFEVGGITLISRLIDGQFPNYKQLIPETFDYEVAVDRDELLEAVRRVGLLAQKNAPLRLQFADNTLTVSAESQDVGKAHEAMPIQYSGDDLEIGFNPEFLEAGVAAVKEITGLPALHQSAAPRAGQGRRRRLPLSGHAHPPERLGMAVPPGRTHAGEPAAPQPVAVGLPITLGQFVKVAGLVVDRRRGQDARRRGEVQGERRGRDPARPQAGSGRRRRGGRRGRPGRDASSGADGARVRGLRTRRS